jgi:glycosyltransferase involved in cell wall biosynthesis
VLAAYRTGKAAAVYFKLVSAAARRADFIFADSEHSKQDILRYLKIAPSKVSVVYLGVEERYTASPLTGDERFGLLRKYGLNGDERIIFYLGGFDVRKNVPMLIEAFGMALPALKNSEREDGIGRWKLVLGGKRHTSNPRMYPDLTPTVEKALGNETNRVHFTGLIDEADKPLFYRAADLYVFPSTYEGFGLDPLEALASGAPVICSNASSLPEVTGNAARLVSPSLVTGWRDAILELASDSYKRAALSALGPLQASRFTWRKTAERTLELYRMLECINTRGK